MGAIQDRFVASRCDERGRIAPSKTARLNHAPNGRALSTCRLAPNVERGNEEGNQRSLEASPFRQLRPLARARPTRSIKIPNQYLRNAPAGTKQDGNSKFGRSQRSERSQRKRRRQNNERDQAEDEPRAFPCRRSSRHLNSRPFKNLPFRSSFVIDNSYFARICCPALRMHRYSRPSQSPAMRWVRQRITEARSKRLFGGQANEQSFSERQGEYHEVFS